MYLVLKHLPKPCSIPFVHFLKQNVSLWLVKYKSNFCHNFYDFMLPLLLKALIRLIHTIIDYLIIACLALFRLKLQKHAIVWILPSLQGLAALQKYSIF